MNIKQIALSGLAATAIVTAAAAPALACKPEQKPVEHKVGICHATGSATNPYVFITVDEHAVKAHQSHQDGRDIIGVKSAANCPKPVVKQPTPSPSPSPAPGKGQVLSSTTQPAPTELPKTGAEAGLSALIGIPAMAATASGYLRAKRNR